MASELRFDNKVVAITGAGGGVGKAHALDLAKRGAKIVVNDLGGAPDGSGGSSSMADKVVAEIKDAGGEAVANYDSVADPKGAARITEMAMDNWGRLDGMIANAGILRDRSFSKMSVEEFETVLDVHLRGTFYSVQPAFNQMKAAGNGGRIMVTSSLSGLLGNFGQTNYSAAKMGIVGMMRIVAIEGQKDNIFINALAPGADTRLTRGEGGENLESDNSPTRVAPLVTALMHESSDITGEIYWAGMGWYSRLFVAMTPGWDSGEKWASAEDIVDHMDIIRSSENVQEPRDVTVLNDVRTFAKK